MQIWLNLMLAVQLIAAFTMIGLVLVQHGKGADMGASFGSGASGSLFGATGSANFLSRSTAVCAAIFFVSTLVLSYFGNLGTAADSGGSVFERGGAASAPATAPAPVVGQIPTAPVASAPAATGGAASATAGAASGAAIPNR
jgi:preprotein translocase subunit SecG